MAIIIIVSIRKVYFRNIKTNMINSQGDLIE